MTTLPKFFLTDYSENDSIWDQQRSTSQAVQELYQSADYSKYKAASFSFYRYAERIQDCSNILKFGFNDDNKLKLKQTFFCRVRYCPVCQWRRSMMWRAKFFQLMPELQEKYPTHRWVFLTLTVKNCPIDDLNRTLKLMSKSWNKFIKYKQLKGIVGFVRTTEITRGKDGSAHPHYHCLLLVRPSFFTTDYVKNDDFRYLWGQALNVDYLPVTHVKAVKGDSIEKAVLETLKYSTKPDDFFTDKDWFFKLTKHTHNMRFVSTGGILKNSLKDEKNINNDDMVNTGADETEEEKNQRLEEEKLSREEKDKIPLIAFYYNDVIRKYHRANKYDNNYND